MLVLALRRQVCYHICHMRIVTLALGLLCAVHAVGGVQVINGDVLLDRTIKLTQDCRQGFDTYRISVGDGQSVEIAYSEYSRHQSDECGGITVQPSCSGVLTEAFEDDAGSSYWRVLGPAVFSVQAAGTPAVRGELTRWNDFLERDVSVGTAYAKEWSASVSYLLRVTYSDLSSADKNADFLLENYGGAAAAAIVSPFWNPTKRVYEGKVTNGGEVVGAVRIKVGKASRGRSRVSVEVMTLTGKRYTSKSVSVANSLSERALVKLPIERLGMAYLVLGQGEFAGRVSGFGTIECGCIGCELAATAPHFRLQSPITLIGDQPVESGMLPMDVPLVQRGSRFSAAPGVQNPSKLWLGYNKTSGKITGAFKVYVKRPNGKLRAFSFKVRGLVIDGVGYAKAYHLNGRYETSASLSDPVRQVVRTPGD